MNKFQTPLTDELKNSLPREVWENLLEYISTVKFIENLIAPEEIRGFIKDRPIMTFIDETGKEIKYEDGRRVIDLTKPHILENMDFFRERAIFFEKNNRYTNLIPNGNPKSDYAEFWREELKKWKYGLVREDGEWIPGELYFYWNYSPIWLTEKIKGSKSKKRTERVRKFPKPWLGDYLFHHYIHAAKEAGQHGKLLKTRGVGFLEPNSSLVHTPFGKIEVGNIKIGDQLIDRKGLPTKVLEVYPQGKQDIYEVEFTDGRKVKCGLNHLWKVKYKNKYKVLKTKDLLDRKLSNYINSKKFTKYYYELPKINPIKYEKKQLKISPYLLGVLIGDGYLSGNNISFSTNDLDQIDLINNELEDKFFVKKNKGNNYSYNILSKDHINEIKREINKLELNIKAPKKFIPKNYLYSSIDDRFELLRGLMDTDGSITSTGYISFLTSSKKLRDDFIALVRSLGIKCTYRLTDLHTRKNTFNKIPCWQISLMTKEKVFKLPRKLKRLKRKKYINDKVYFKNIKNLNYKEESTCFLVDNNEHLYLTTDFIPTHNSFKTASWSPRNMYIHPGSGNPNFHLASEKGFLSGDKGIWGKVLDTLDWIAAHTPFPRMRLVDGKRAMEVQLGYEDEYGSRKGLLSSVFGISLKDNPDKARGIRGPLIHYEEDGLFPNLEKAWGVNRKAVEDGDVSFGFMLAGGTGGVEGSSFEGSEKLFYKPGAYNIYAIPNIFDKNTNGETKCGFFWGAYMNRNLCYEENNGEPDIIKALIEILLDRHKVKYNSSDANALTQKKAEEPITPQEAVMRTEGTVFPVADLKEYLETIAAKKDHFIAEHYIGELVYSPNGQVEWKPTLDKFPIRTYDTKGGTDKEGCLEIFTMPRKNSDGIIQRGRYIAGIDPIDADTGQSLFSILVMDTFTDQIVAEYSGRPRTANEAYEIALRTLKFYNAEGNYESNLKGLFSYFDKKNSLHYLADTPQILKDMDFVKQTNLYGNRAKGTHANAFINSWGRSLQADWMLSETSDSEPENPKYNLHTLRSLAYIEECIKWNADGNFDRVSAAGMLFILREDRYKRIEYAKQRQEDRIQNLANDPFFNKNFTSRIGLK